MSIKLGVVMDPIQNITYYKDTTLALLLAAQERGFELFYMEQKDLFLDGGKAKAGACRLQVMADE